MATMTSGAFGQQAKAPATGAFNFGPAAGQGGFGAGAPLGSFGAGGFGAGASGGFAVQAAPGGNAAVHLGALPLPQAPSLCRLERLEEALDSDSSDLEQLKNQGFGADGYILKNELIEPFLEGFKLRNGFDRELRAEADKQVLAKVFSTKADAIFVDQPAKPGVRKVAAGPDIERDFERVGLGNMKEKEIPKAFIEPWLKLASEVALELRENVVRCLHLVLTAKDQAVPGADDNTVKEHAVRTYFSQQQRILTIICRVLTTNELLHKQPASEVDEKLRDLYGLVCGRVILFEKPVYAEKSGRPWTFCDGVKEAMEYNLERYTATTHPNSICDPSAPFYRQKRRGIEMEMRLLCELLQERLRCNGVMNSESVSEDTKDAEARGFKDAMEKVLRLYMFSAGQLKEASASTDSKHLCIIFYGTMLASTISYALLDPDRDLRAQSKITQWYQSEIASWHQSGSSITGAPQPAKATLLEEGLLPKETVPLDLHSAESKPCVGYVQLVLACMPGTARKQFRKWAVYNQALSFLDKDMLACLTHDRWAEYRDKIAKSCGLVLRKILESQDPLLSKIIRPDIRSPETYPSDRYQMLTSLLGALGQVYSMTSTTGQLGSAGNPSGLSTSSYVLDRDAGRQHFDSIKKHVSKIVSEVKDVKFLYSIRRAWYDLLSAALDIRIRPDERAQSTLNQLSIDVMLQLSTLGAEFELEDKTGSEDFVHPDFLAHLERWSDELRLEARLPHWSEPSVAQFALNQEMRRYCINANRRQLLGLLGTRDAFDTDRILYHRSWLKLMRSLWRSMNTYLGNDQSFPTQGFEHLVKLCSSPFEDRAYYVLTPEFIIPTTEVGGYRGSARPFNRLADLWLGVVPAQVKAEILGQIEELAANSIAVEKAGAPYSAVDKLERIWKEFICGRVLMRGVMHTYQRDQWEPLDRAPFHYEFLELDRDLACYEHTLAFLRLLNTIFQWHVPFDGSGGARVEDATRVDVVIFQCIMLLPQAEGEDWLFQSASDRWKLYSEVLRIIETVLRTLFDTMHSGPDDWRKHPARPLFEQVLRWVVQPESHGQGGLRSRMMDLLSLGLQIAEESLDESELPHLAGALEVALRVVHLVTFICNSEEEYHQWCMLEAIIAERGRVRPGGKKLRSLLVSILCYVTLNDEPRLAWRALQLMQLICRTRDQDVLQVLVSDTSEASRDHIVMAFADWLKQSDKYMVELKQSDKYMVERKRRMKEEGVKAEEGCNDFETYMATCQHDVSTSIFDFILDSLARVEDEHSTAHFLLGFIPYQPALSDLGKDCPTTKLLQVVYSMCGDEDRWMAKYEDLLDIREANETEDGIMFVGGMEESGLARRETELSLMARNEHCVEILYRLVAHLGTREAALRLLLDPHAYERDSGRASGEARVGKLLDMMESLPIDKAMQQGTMVQALRREIKGAWAGGGLEMLQEQWIGEEDLQNFQRYWKQGKRDLSWQDAADDWGLDLNREGENEVMLRSIERCQNMRVLIDTELELQLSDAQECLLNFYHQSGWFLRTVAILLHSTREQLCGVVSNRSAGDGRHINFRLDHAKKFFQTLFGFPESGGGGRGASASEGLGPSAGAGRGVPVWSRGKFQKLMCMAMDLWEVELNEADVIDEITASISTSEDLIRRKTGERAESDLSRQRILNPEDLEECKKCVDRWSEGTLWMLDEKKLQHRLDARLHLQCMFRPPDYRPPDDSITQGCIFRRVLGAYDGFNTVRRCRSAREHLLCGLQDVLEHALIPVGPRGQPLLAHVFGLDQEQLDSFLFDLLSLLRRPDVASGPETTDRDVRKNLFAQAHVASHLGRCISLVISAIALPHVSRAGVVNDGQDESRRQYRLRDLDFLLSVPSMTIATSDVSLRADLYSAILKLLQYLKRPRVRTLDGQDSFAVGESPQDLEEVLTRHRTELFRVAVLDIASLPAERASPAESRLECESKASALAIIQMLLPKAKPSHGLQQGMAATLMGLLVHHNLVAHLTQDLLPGDAGANLGEVLDVTKTEDKQPQLLIFTGKMNVLLQLAQDAEGMRELAHNRTIHKLAQSRYLISHVQTEQHLRTLIRPHAGGAHSAGVLGKRFHLLLLPTLKLLVMLLHDVTEGCKITEPALEFLWSHRYLVCEVLRVNTGGAAGSMHVVGGTGAGWQGSAVEEIDECIEERRLLLDAFLIMERLGAFIRKPPMPETATGSQPPAASGTGSTSGGGVASTSVGGVRIAELDALLTAATADLMRALLEDCSKSSFWQTLEVACGAQKATSSQARSARRAMQMLQTCEISLRLYLTRARRLGTRSARMGGPGHDMQPDFLVFDCSSILPGGVGLAGGRSFGLQREHRVPVESLVHFFCRCVEHLCGGGESDVPPGAGVANGFGAAGFSAGAPSALPRSGGSGGFTRTGVLTVWRRYMDLQQRARESDGAARDSDCRLQYQAVKRIVVQLFRLCEIALSALVESITLAMDQLGEEAEAPAFGGSAPRGGLLAHFGSQNCLDAVWNMQRTGGAQRLLRFARQLSDDPSSSSLCDSVFIQGMAKRLVELVETVQQQG